MCSIDDYLLLFPKQLPKTSSFSTSLFHGMMHDLCMQKLDKNSSPWMYVPWSIHTHLLFHVRYGQQYSYCDDFKTANLAAHNQRLDLQSCLLRQGNKVNKPLQHRFLLEPQNLLTKLLFFNF